MIGSAPAPTKKPAAFKGPPRDVRSRGRRRNNERWAARKFLDLALFDPVALHSLPADLRVAGAGLTAGSALMEELTLIEQLHQAGSVAGEPVIEAFRKQIRSAITDETVRPPLLQLGKGDLARLHDLFGEEVCLSDVLSKFQNEIIVGQRQAERGGQGLVVAQDLPTACDHRGS